MSSPEEEEEEEEAISASLCDDDSSIADKRYALLLEYPSLAEAEDEDEDESNDDEDEEKLKLGKLAARAVTLMSSFLFHLLERKWRLWCCRSKRRSRRKQEERADKALEAAWSIVVVVIFTRARGCVCSEFYVSTVSSSRAKRVCVCGSFLDRLFSLFLV